MKQSMFDLDLARLEEHCLDQPRRMEKAVRMVASGKDRLDRARAELDLTESTAEFAVRSSPTEFGITKISEAAVKAAVKGHKDVQRMVRKVNRWKYKVNLREGVVTALEHRKRMLETLTTLHGQSYFAKPKARGLVTSSSFAADERKSRIRNKGKR